MNLSSLMISEGGRDAYVPGHISFDGQVLRTWENPREVFSEDVIAVDFDALRGGGLNCRPVLQLVRRGNGFWSAKRVCPDFELDTLQLGFLESLAGWKGHGHLVLQGDIPGRITHYVESRQEQIVFQRFERMALDIEFEERGVRLEISGKLGALQAAVIGNDEKGRQSALRYGERYRRNSFEIGVVLPVELLIARNMFTQQMQKRWREP